MLPLFLMVGIIGWVVPLVSQASSGRQLADGSSGSSLQVTATPTLTVTPTISATITPVPPLTQTSPGFQVTFEELGYGEEILESPWGSIQYSFRLPDNWLVKDDSFLDLELSYFFTDLGRREEEKLQLTFFGEVSVYVDGRLLQVYALNEPTLEHVRLRVDLPPDLFNENPGASHQIKVELSASFLCNVLHKAELVIHPESALFFYYTLLPPTLDLLDYPRPFYQNSFEPDQVSFVLPVHPSESEMSAAAAIAAELGDLTSNDMVISATTDVNWLEMVAMEDGGSGHLLVIGRPDRNQLVAWLNDNVDLPVPIRHRQMALNSQGPAAALPGDTFNYTVTVTNTLQAPTASLSLIDRLPYYTELVACDPACTEIGRSQVSWSLESLSPGDAASFSLTLQLSDTVVPSPEAPVLENVAILVDEAEVPLNISSLTTNVGPAPAEGNLSFSSSRDGYFFVQDGQPVTEGDGVLQEVVSPWDPQKAILLVTGAGDEAVYKASQALSLGTSFPAMKGPVTLVRQVRLLPPASETLTVDRTLADLGYKDQTLYGLYDHVLSYWFRVPWGWQLTDDAYLRLLFRHSEAISRQGSTLGVFLNGSPLTTVALDQETAVGGSLEVNLPGSQIRRGASNNITVHVSIQTSGAECRTIDASQAWLSVSSDSLLHLDHQVREVSTLDLDYFPVPFNTQPDLQDVLFVLPPVPGAAEQTVLLQLASILGDSAGLKDFNAVVSSADMLDEEILGNYHVIAIGRPTVNSLTQQVNSLLPQPFVPGTDEIEQQVGEVLLRLPAGISLGYIQEIPSPWNEKRALLIVTGTTDEGVAWAANALSRQSWRLAGNLILVRGGGEEVYTIDTRKLTRSGMASTVTTAVPELTPSATITPPTQRVETASADTLGMPSPSPVAASEARGLPTWVISFIGITAVIVVAIFGVVVWRPMRRRGQ